MNSNGSSITVLAPAKINLGLEILPVRSDGFHNIRSIFTTVPLWDTLEVSVMENEENICTVECDSMNLPEENTLTVAYKAFCVLTGIKKGVHVKVTKRIPAGGGLGGGSSDASSFIQSLNRIFYTQLSDLAMMELAGKVGSDVYFFTEALNNSKTKGTQYESFTAYVSGRGENVESVNLHKEYSLVLVFPKIGVSTKDAYRLADEYTRISLNYSKEKLVDIYEKPLSEWDFRNDFTAPIAEKFAEVREPLDMLRKTDADFCDMTGSGSTVFGVFENREKALQAKEVLERFYKTVLV